MGCVFCQREELTCQNGIQEVYNHDKEVSSFVCSNCVQKLLRMPQSQIIEAYQTAIEKGHLDKAYWLESLIDEEMEEVHVTETRETRSDMGRERSVRSTRSSRNKVRA